LAATGAPYTKIQKKICMSMTVSQDHKKLLPYLYKNAKEKGFKLIDVNKKSDQHKNSFICGALSLSWLSAVNKFGIEAARHI
jgi:hypothetical protein